MSTNPLPRSHSLSTIRTHSTVERPNHVDRLKRKNISSEVMGGRRRRKLKYTVTEFDGYTFDKQFTAQRESVSKPGQPCVSRQSNCNQHDAVDITTARGHAKLPLSSTSVVTVIVV